MISTSANKKSFSESSIEDQTISALNAVNTVNITSEEDDFCFREYNSESDYNIVITTTNTKKNNNRLYNLGANMLNSSTNSPVDTTATTIPTEVESIPTIIPTEQAIVAEQAINPYAGAVEAFQIMEAKVQKSSPPGLVLPSNKKLSADDPTGSSAGSPFNLNSSPSPVDFLANMMLAKGQGKHMNFSNMMKGISPATTSGTSIEDILAQTQQAEAFAKAYAQYAEALKSAAMNAYLYQGAAGIPQAGVSAVAPIPIPSYQTNTSANSWKQAHQNSWEQDWEEDSYSYYGGKSSSSSSDWWSTSGYYGSNSSYGKNSSSSSDWYNSFSKNGNSWNSNYSSSLSEGGGPANYNTVQLNKRLAQSETIEACFKVVEDHSESFDNVNVVTALFRCAKLKTTNGAYCTTSDKEVYNHVEFKKLMQMFSDNLEEISSRGLANVMWAFAKLNVPIIPKEVSDSSSSEEEVNYEDLMDKVCKKASASVNTYNPQALSNLIWAFTTLVEHGTTDFCRLPKVLRNELKELFVRIKSDLEITSEGTERRIDKVLIFFGAFEAQQEKLNQEKTE